MKNQGFQQKYSSQGETSETIEATMDDDGQLEGTEEPDFSFHLDMMMLLDTEKISDLRREFEKEEDGLTLFDFVAVMKRFLKNVQLRDEELVANLCDLFAQIDLNGDGTMEWDEFTSYIIDTANGTICTLKPQRARHQRGTTLSEDERKAEGKETPLNDNEDILKYHPMRPRLNGHSKNELVKIKTAIKQVYYFRSIDRVVLIEQDSSRLKICRPTLAALHEITLESDAGKAVCCEHSCSYGYIVSTSSSKILVYEESSLRLYKEFQPPSLQHCLRYLARTDTLFSTGVNGIIFAWNLQKVEGIGAKRAAGKAVMSRTLKSIVNVETLRPTYRLEAEKFRLGGTEFESGNLLAHSHEDMILDLLVNESFDRVVSCGMDGSIKLWDATTGWFCKSLVGHSKGVKTLAYSPQCRILISGGFDYDLFVWNPYIGNLIIQLIGHSYPIIRICFAEQSPHFISSDLKGYFRVWNVKNFSCVQSMTALGCDLLRSLCVATVNGLPVIYGAGKTIYGFKYFEVPNPELTHARPVIAVFHNETTNTLFTASANEIKLWTVEEGSELACFDQVVDPEDEISAVCLDDRQRKFILGTHVGKINVFDYVNGTLMKGTKLPLNGATATAEMKHPQEISQLLYVSESKLLLCSSWNGSLFIFDESKADTIPLLRTILGAHQGCEIDSLSYSPKYSLISSLSKVCEIQLAVWDFEFGRLDGVCELQTATGTPVQQSLKDRNQCLCVSFHDERLPILIAAYQGFEIKLWFTRPANITHRYKIIKQFSLQDRALKSLFQSPLNGEFCIIIPGVERFLVADTEGRVFIFSLTKLYDELANYSVQEMSARTCANSRRILTTDARSLLTVTSCTNKQANLMKDLPDEVLLQAWFRAHETQITAMHIVMSPESLITSSMDCTVRIHDLEGNLLGQLRQMRQPASTWKFEVDTRQRQADKLALANSILKDIGCAERNEQEDASDTGSTSKEYSDGTRLPEFLGSLQKSEPSMYGQSPVTKVRRRMRPITRDTAGKGLSLTPRGQRSRLME